jgi:hypothetical protein
MKTIEEHLDTCPLAVFMKTREVGKYGRSAKPPKKIKSVKERLKQKWQY